MSDTLNDIKNELADISAQVQNSNASEYVLGCCECAIKNIAVSDGVDEAIIRDCLKAFEGILKHKNTGKYILWNCVIHIGYIVNSEKVGKETKQQGLKIIEEIPSNKKDDKDISKACTVTIKIINDLLDKNLITVNNQNQVQNQSNGNFEPSDLQQQPLGSKTTNKLSHSERLMQKRKTIKRSNSI